MFLTPAGNGELRPSFFEMYAQQNIVTTLRGAQQYALDVASLRFPFLFRVAARSDELFLILHILLESNSLLKSNATVAEAFYGLRRVPATSENADRVFSAQAHRFPARPLRSRYIVSSLVCETLVPYIRAKLDALHEQISGGAAARLLGEASDPLPPSNSDGRSNHLLRKARRLFQKLYPLLRASFDVCTLLYNILYLFGSTKYYHFLNHIQGLVIRRLTSNEYSGHSEPQFIPSRSIMSRLTRAVDRMIAALKISIVVGVFAFKFAEYYYLEQKKSGSQEVSPPPPPQPMTPAQGGIKLPDSNLVCPICLNVRSNPAACGSSGFVFCYRCIFEEVEKNGKCPVSLLPTTTADIRRLYD